jgi:hypothetical protein
MKVSLGELPSLHDMIVEFVADIAADDRHPLRSWKSSLTDDVDRSMSSGNLSLSFDGSRLIELFAAFDHVRLMPNSSRLIEAIRNRSTFFSGAYEILTVTEYRHRGYNVEIRHEEDGQRTSDFVLHFRDGPVYVEVKSLTDLSSDERVYCQEIAKRKLSAIRKRKRSWHLRVRPDKSLRRGEQERVLSAIDQIAKANELGLTTLLGKRVSLECRPISEWGCWIEGTGIYFTEQFDVGAATVEMRTDEANKVYISNPVIVGVDPVMDVDIAKRIVDRIKKASAQLKAPSILHLQMPFTDGNLKLDAVDTVFDSVWQRLTRNHSRLNAIILTSQIFLPPHRQPSNTPIQYPTYIVPNGRCKLPLPSEFTVGPTKAEFVLAETGVFFFSFSAREDRRTAAGKRRSDHESKWEAIVQVLSGRRGLYR